MNGCIYVNLIGDFISAENCISKKDNREYMRFTMYCNTWINGEDVQVRVNAVAFTSKFRRLFDFAPGSRIYLSAQLQDVYSPQPITQINNKTKRYYSIDVLAMDLFIINFKLKEENEK